MTLTAKQQRFVEEYCSNGFNATQAAKSAGYSEKTAWSIGQENLKKPLVKEALDKFMQESSQRNKITVDTLLSELEEARKIALSAETPQSSAAVTATMSKAKLLGLDKQVIELSGKDGGPIKTMQMTKEDFAELKKQVMEEDDC